MRDATMSDFDEISWPELTSADYAAIDQLCIENIKAEAEKGAATIQIEAEDVIDAVLKNDSGENSKSPFALFRRRGYLSVTDIIAPAWCEVQFDYGLRQRRFLPVKERPKTFTTEKGKEIQVSTKVAEKNDKVTRGGRAIHKKLEKEIHKVEIVVPVQTLEESWALRILDALVRLKILKDKGVCRELPVCGIFHDEAIIGIIDELRLETNVLPRSPKKRKGNEPSSSSQISIDSFFRTPAFKKPVSSDEKLVLKVSDSKTRQSARIPSHTDTFPSRLQVMLYRRLLDQFLNFSPVLFLELCTRLNIYPDKKFSDSFVGEMGSFVVDNDLDLHFLDTTCLAEMLDTYTSSMKDFTHNVELSDNLYLVYRKRGRNKPQELKSNVKANGSNQGDPPSSLDVGKCVSEKGSLQVPPPKRKRSSSSESDNSSKGSTSGAETEAKDEEGNLGNARHDSSAYNIIGTKKFKYNEILLEKHMENILLWWRGKRAPRGVDIENAGRCNSCEYRDGCEWREQKALEHSSESRGLTHSERL